jgi:hypothetical protein
VLSLRLRCHVGRPSRCRSRSAPAAWCCLTQLWIAMSWQGLGTTGERICNDLVSHLRPIALSKEAARASCIETRAAACARLAHPLFWRLDYVDDRRSQSKHHNDRLPFFIIPGLVLLASPTLRFIIRSLCYRPTSSIDFFGRPLLASLIAIVGLASAALLPHYASKLERVVAAKPTLAAAYPTWPFYFGYVRCENSVNVCLAIARD